jgi:hypothetical protein
MRRFVSAAIEPAGNAYVTAATGTQPPVPRAFSWDGRQLVIAGVVRAWRSSKNDRGDVYLRRHWFELRIDTGATIEVYYDRQTRGRTCRWWLYAIDE